MPSPLLFLVVDHHAESRFLLVKTLLRKFADAVIYEADDAERAVAVARENPLAAIITHRIIEEPGADLVRKFRAVRPTRRS